MELPTIGSPALWLGFLGFVVAMLALDLGVFHRRAHEVRVLIGGAVAASLLLPDARAGAAAAEGEGAGP